jgi:hypothetical protein
LAHSYCQLVRVPAPLDRPPDKRHHYAMDPWRQAVLLAAILLAIVFLVLATADAGMATAGVERCPLKFPKWFGCVLATHENLSGGLIGAAGALFAAWLAWQAIMKQISQAETQSESRRQREEVASRTVLPLAVSDMSRYARDCIQLLSKYVYAERPVVPPNLETPQTSSETIGIFRDCARFADPEIASQIHALLSSVQVQQARLRDLFETSRGGHIPVREGVDAILDAADVHAKIDDLFDYARDTDAARNRVSPDRLRTALRTSGIWEDDHPAHERINQMLAPQSAKLSARQQRKLRPNAM